jgi:hypothetical protein
VERRPQEPTPCHTCPKIPPGAEPRSENAEDLNATNARAYIHYLECRATGRWPDDGKVRHNAAVIRAVEDAVGGNDANKLAAVLTAALEKKAK